MNARAEDLNKVRMKVRALKNGMGLVVDRGPELVAPTRLTGPCLRL